MVKFTLEKAMVAQCRSRGIALPFLQPQFSMGVGGYCHAHAA